MELLIAILLGGFVLVAVVILIVVNRKKNKTSPTNETPSTPASDCCGAHEVCEVDLIKMDESRIEYYDDEELDAYKNIPENEYTNEQIDKIREVLYTLKTNEILQWLLSIERRKINLPTILLEESRMLIAEN